MNFRLKHRAISSELQRLVRKELDAAVKRLDRGHPGEREIHQARKAIKKVRAIVKLLRVPLGYRYAIENARLRAAGRALAPLRDADAMLQTIAALQGRYSAVIAPALGQDVAHELQRRRQAVRRHSRTMPSQALRKLKASRRTLPGRIADAGKTSCVRTGLVRSYKSARSVLADLTLQSGPAAFHTWRRRVKEHWYHVQLFQAARSAPRTRARTLKTLESALGEAHNLALLREILLEEPDRFGGARPTALVLGCVQKRQHALRRLSLVVGRRTFASKPKKFDKTIERWWRWKA